MCLSTNFSIVFTVKDDRLIGRYALGLGVNITLTCLQAMGIYPCQAGSQDST